MKNWIIFLCILVIYSNGTKFYSLELGNSWIYHRYPGRLGTDSRRIATRRIDVIDTFSQDMQRKFILMIQDTIFSEWKDSILSINENLDTCFVNEEQIHNSSLLPLNSIYYHKINYFIKNEKDTSHWEIYDRDFNDSTRIYKSFLEDTPMAVIEFDQTWTKGGKHQAFYGEGIGLLWYYSSEYVNWDYTLELVAFNDESINSYDIYSELVGIPIIKNQLSKHEQLLVSATGQRGCLFLKNSLNNSVDISIFKSNGKLIHKLKVLNSKKVQLKSGFYLVNISINNYTNINQKIVIP